MLIGTAEKVTMTNSTIRVSKSGRTLSRAFSIDLGCFEVK